MSALQESPRRRYGFGVAGVAVALMMIAGSAPSPFYPLLAQRLSLAPIVITVVFAVYAVVLLAALLVTGSLSDHIGRRPVIAVGFAVLAVSMVLFWGADSAAALILARAVQGLATGLLISALSAAVTDFAPAAPLGATVNSVAPTSGLAIGAILAGALLQGSEDGAIALFPALAIAYALLAVAVLFAPESSPRHEGWARAMRPRVAVPPSARRLFASGVPLVIAGWATGGLFFSLGPSILRADLGVTSHAAQGAIIGLLALMGAATAFALRAQPSRTAALHGATALAAGTVLSLVALSIPSLPVYILAVAITGSGFGSAFMGVVGLLAPAVAAHERAELFAALYTVSYLAFSVPAVLAGALQGVVGLHATVMGYGALVALAAALAAVLRLRRPVVA